MHDVRNLYPQAAGLQAYGLHLTLEMCVPSERCMPEQPMHTSEPKGRTAQSGGAASSPQSAQQRLACAS